MNSVHYEDIIRIWPSAKVANELKAALERAGFELKDGSPEYQEIAGVKLVKCAPSYGERVWKIFRPKYGGRGYREAWLIEYSASWGLRSATEFDSRWSLVFLLKREGVIIEGDNVVC